MLYAKRIPVFILLLFVFANNVFAQHKPVTYYISPSGNDKHNGLSPLQSWKSISKLNTHSFQPGDKILLQAGKIFNGSVKLDSAHNGLTGKPVTIGSYGNGKAIIYSGSRTGIYGYNCSNIRIINLTVRGNGPDSNQVAGIHFYTDRKDKYCSGIEINNCEASGYNQQGIFFSAAEDEKVTGYDHVRIVYCKAYNNGEAGISSYAGQTLFHHKNFYIGYCKAYQNKGILSKTNNHSGNGIVMGQVENLIIEHCEAYENGENNRCTGGGPVGIWVWLCKNAVIQYCESHHNHAGLTKDGGGFDIDGGAVDCIIQYNYSHDNEGAGYLLAEYGAGLPFSNNCIRFNISRDDGRKNSYGAISIWGVDTNNKVRNSFVHNNTIYVSGNTAIEGTPCAVRLMGPNFQNVLVAHNIFTSDAGAALINSTDEPDTGAIRFADNNFYSYNKIWEIHWGRFEPSSINAWFQLMSAGEKPIQVNPGFTGPGRSITIGDTRKLRSVLAGYKLKPGSPLLRILEFKRELPIKYPATDFFGHPLSSKTRAFAGIAIQ